MYMYNYKLDEIIYCVCGSDYMARHGVNIRKHEKTIKHIEFMKTYIKPLLASVR